MTSTEVREPDRPADITGGVAEQAGIGGADGSAEDATAAERALLERNEALTLIHGGLATTATVDTLRDTGARVNGRAVAEMRLLVRRASGDTYLVVRSAVVPDSNVDLATVAVSSSGRPRRIPVLVDPGRPGNVLLRWDLRPAS
ncbi:hypothetical protein [Frankia sp. AgKG'84/4]|uniref:hypothetical protein n=1 Tax=Frankia sp. AgKG'84/4 TaxID=573490 RepID=UPI0020106CD2|nr:hypothetical protein [Frankia sp. AgKG'84/4]MCL9793165.1 hypothetical protein [Frankia sp. AgKG'84/4]